MHEPLTIDEYRELTNSPIHYGCYETIFFFTGIDAFCLCSDCNHTRISDLKGDIITGDLQVFAESSSNIDPSNCYCDHCGKDVSAYEEN